MKLKLIVLSVLAIALCGQGRPVAPSQIQSVSGNGPTLVTTRGPQVSGNFVEIDANGNHVDSGTACCGGGGGAGLLQVATVVVPESAVLTLDTVPVTVIPAPGAGKLLVIHSIVTVTHGSATYTTSGQLEYDTGLSLVTDTSPLWASGFTNYLNSVQLAGTDYNNESSDTVNQPLVAHATAPVTGTGGNFVISVYYTILTVQ